ncbi:sugar phosphate isomerase/epimerase family protein [Streptomyces sp. NPDC093064]|uniref:sugar phosphate isomerase/epimerase family protein n=1 Tax=unclassified Streptomyces TaxID=2593676 RepID=UPI003678326A
MRVGLSCEYFPGSQDRSARATLHRAAEEGLDGVAFASPLMVSRRLDRHELVAIRDLAADLGLYLEVGIGAIATPDRVIPAGEAESLLDACLVLGSTEITAYTKLDRFDPGHAFPVQLDGVVTLLTGLARKARNAHAHLNLETHEDLTSTDVFRVVQAVGPDVAGVTFDLANAVVRGEHPLHVLEQLAPYVRQTQLEDVTLSLTKNGLRRHLAPCGGGITDWAKVIDVLGGLAEPPNLTVEQHRGQFDIEVFDPTWVDAHPDLQPAGVLALVAEAVRSARQDRDGTWLQLSQEPQARGEQEFLEHLRLSADHLRLVLAESSRTDRTTADGRETGRPHGGGGTYEGVQG